MTATLPRSYAAELELRGGDGRTLVGLACPFNSPADILEGGQRFSESVAPGAFARTITQRDGKVPLFAVHDTTRRLPLGRCSRRAVVRDRVTAGGPVGGVLAVERGGHVTRQAFSPRRERRDVLIPVGKV
jgi:Caudovirus prohead protease.